jgi:hypothetical protein
MAKKEDKQMTSVRVSTESQTIIKLIKKQYKDNESVTTQDDAFLEFMKINHPELYKEAIRIASFKRELDELWSDD